jgi:hypothetical protein
MNFDEEYDHSCKSFITILYLKASRRFYYESEFELLSSSHLGMITIKQLSLDHIHSFSTFQAE